MKSLSCADMGSSTCGFVAAGRTDGEVMSKMTEHVAADHPDDMKKMQAMGEEKMNAMMKSKIRDT